jgi:hypothetical protein
MLIWAEKTYQSLSPWVRPIFFPTRTRIGKIVPWVIGIGALAGGFTFMPQEKSLPTVLTPEIKKETLQSDWQWILDHKTLDPAYISQGGKYREYRTHDENRFVVDLGNADDTIQLIERLPNGWEKILLTAKKPQPKPLNP